MKSALIIGASRGIGRSIALTLAKNGYQVGIAAKTVESSDKLPGSIFTVATEVENLGGKALPIVCNVREEAQIKSAVEQCYTTFGNLDVAIYNAGAILWNQVIDTPTKRFDLLNDVNVRGAYILVQEVLSHFLQQRHGKIILVAPPIYSRFFKGKAPYAATKVGMTVLVNGLASELEGTGVSITALWPATTIKAHVTDVKGVSIELMRNPEIFADACLSISEEKTDKLNGLALIDEDYLRTTGVTDFSQYRCVFDTEPPRMMPRQFPSLLVEEEIIDSKL